MLHAVIWDPCLIGPSYLGLMGPLVSLAKLIKAMPHALHGYFRKQFARLYAPVELSLSRHMRAMMARSIWVLPRARAWIAEPELRIV